MIYTVIYVIKMETYVVQDKIVSQSMPDGTYYLPETDETIAADIAAPSPDNRFHHCIYYPVANEFDRWGGPTWEDKPKTRCFFAPMNTM
jgi:hypothetical protein